MAAYRFDFVVTGLNKEQADLLDEMILEQVTKMEGTIGGGFAELPDEVVAFTEEEKSFEAMYDEEEKVSAEERDEADVQFMNEILNHINEILNHISPFPGEDKDGGLQQKS